MDRLTVQFDHLMDVDSFDLSDVVSFTGPSGPITVMDFAWDEWWPRGLALIFPPQSELGDYELVLAPTLLDQNGNPLDNDWDDSPGEDQEDRYTTTFRIVPPRVTSHTPSGTTQAPVTKVMVYFNHSIDPASFSIADDVVSFTGPDGEIELTNHRWPYSSPGADVRRAGDRGDL